MNDLRILPAVACRDLWKVEPPTSTLPCAARMKDEPPTPTLPRLAGEGALMITGAVV